MKYNKVIEGLSRFTHDYSETIDKKEFNSFYGFPGIPVIFKKAFQRMPLKQLWTKERLKKSIRGKDLVENQNIHNEKLKLLMNLDEFFELEESGYYYKTSQHIGSVLYNDYKAPDIFNCWYANTKSGIPKNKLSWLYVGQNDSYTELHRDIWGTSAWNYLVSGKKIWFVFPESLSELIKESFEGNKIQTIVDDPSILLDRKIKPLVAVQEAGDLVYMPGKNYHAVISMAESISLTENFINEINYDQVREHFKRGNNKRNRVSIEAIIKDGFEQLK